MTQTRSTASNAETSRKVNLKLLSRRLSEKAICGIRIPSRRKRERLRERTRVARSLIQLLVMYLPGTDPSTLTKSGSLLYEVIEVSCEGEADR